MKMAAAFFILKSTEIVQQISDYMRDHGNIIQKSKLIFYTKSLLQKKEENIIIKV